MRVLRLTQDLLEGRESIRKSAFRILILGRPRGKPASVDPGSMVSGESGDHPSELLPSGQQWGIRSPRVPANGAANERRARRAYATFTAFCLLGSAAVICMHVAFGANTQVNPPSERLRPTSAALNQL